MNIKPIFFATILILTSFLSQAQKIVTIAGTGVAGFSGDDSLAINAKLSASNSWYTEAFSALVLDNIGNIYFSDISNNRVRKIDAKTKIITTVAGNGNAGYSGDGGLAIYARLNQPSGLAIGTNGNLFISDTYNHCVREVVLSYGLAGYISTVAGNGTAGFSGDGFLAQNSQLNHPMGDCF